MLSSWWSIGVDTRFDVLEEALTDFGIAADKIVGVVLNKVNFRELAHGPTRTATTTTSTMPNMDTTIRRVEAAAFAVVRREMCGFFEVQYCQLSGPDWPISTFADTNQRLAHAHIG